MRGGEPPVLLDDPGGRMADRDGERTGRKRVVDRGGESTWVTESGGQRWREHRGDREWWTEVERAHG